MKLYTIVVHYLQMCMKEYGCCPKFKRAGNSTYTFTKRGDGGMYLVSATPTNLLIIPSCTSAGSVLQMCKVS
jgi:hypothetical protein